MLFSRHFHVFLLKFRALTLLMPNTTSVKTNQAKELCAYIIAKTVKQNWAAKGDSHAQREPGTHQHSYPVTKLIGNHHFLLNV